MLETLLLFSSLCLIRQVSWRSYCPTENIEEQFCGRLAKVLDSYFEAALLREGSDKTGQLRQEPEEEH